MKEKVDTYEGRVGPRKQEDTDPLGPRKQEDIPKVGPRKQEDIPKVGPLKQEDIPKVEGFKQEEVHWAPLSKRTRFLKLQLCRRDSHQRPRQGDDASSHIGVAT